MEVPVSGDATMWIYDGDKWLQQPGGKDGAPGADGNIADATEQGVIATWDNTAGQWTPEGAVVVDASGRVGIGTGNPSNGTSTYYDDLVIKNDTQSSGAGITFQSNDLNGFSGIDFRQADGTGVGKISVSNADARMVLESGGRETMRLDDQNRVGIGGAPSRSTKEIEEEAEATLRNWDSKDKKPTKAELIKQLTERTIGGGTAKLQVAGDGYFSGTVNSTRMIADGHLVMSTRDIIETLHTLREATKDETTLEGLRDSIGNAVGGLIERFEAMQAQVGTQEIQEGPVTQDIQE